MTDFIPGDNYRINIVSDDSTTLVDSWAGYIRASTLDADGSLMVDVDTGTIQGKLIGDVYSENGNTKVLAVSYTGNEATFFGETQGHHEGSVYGVITALEGSALQGTFSGNVIGDLTGNVEGNVTGSLSGNSTGVHTGDVRAPNNDPIIDAEEKTAHFDIAHIGTLNVNIINSDTFGTHVGAVNAPDDSIIAQSVNVDTGHADRFSANSIHSDGLTGILTGTFSGDGTGSFSGDVTGTFAGAATGTFTGAASGTFNGDIIDNNGNPLFRYNSETETMEFTGSINRASNGDPIILSDWTEATPLVRAALNGPLLNSAEEKIIEDQPDNGTTIMSPTERKVQIGDVHHNVRQTSYLIEKHEKYTVNPLNAQHVTLAHRGTANEPSAVRQRDHLYIISNYGYDGNDYKWAGAFGMFQDDSKTHDTASAYMPGKFGISCSDGTEPPSITSDTTVTINSEGVLYSKAAQVGQWTSAQRDAFTPQIGMIIFNTNTNKFQGYTGTNWVDLH